MLAIFSYTGCASLVTENTEGRPILPEPASEIELVLAGEVKVELTSWNWFYQTSEEKRRGHLEQAALTEAAGLFGPEAVIKPESITGRWSPASLLMLFAAAGFVEDAEIIASVWLPAPEKAVEPEPVVLTGVRYLVVPEDEYTSSTEFTTVQYKPLEELSFDLETAFDAGKISEAELSKRRSRLPKAGTVLITYGRTELTNAISRWFSFTLMHNGEQIFRKRGTEDIPYVYGNDKLWWNDKTYKVEIEWTGSLNLVIEDKFQSKIYNYKIIREEYIISDSE